MPTADAAPVLRFRAGFVPPVDSIIEIDAARLNLDPLDDSDRVLLLNRKCWQFRVVEVRVPVTSTSTRGVRAGRAVLLVAPVIVGSQ